MRQEVAIYKPNAAKNHQNTRSWGGRIATGSQPGMSDPPVDFAIVGSTPLSRLLAGLLASAHGKSVVLIGESQAAYRLPRAIDLSIAPITRPQSWALLKAVLPETLKLVSRFGGRSAWSRVDPLLFAESARSKEALAHVRHMALAFGAAAEMVSSRSIGAGRDGLQLRDAMLLHRPALEAGLDRWLDGLGVQRLPGDSGLAIRPDGSAECVTGSGPIAIGQTVLADDMALIRHIPAERWPAVLLRQTSSTILTEPTKPMAAPVIGQLDSGLMLAQQRGRGITAIGPGDIDLFAARAATLLGGERAFRQAGQSSYQTIVTQDGAAAVGRLGGHGPDVLAGLGPTGAFLAPAIARWLSSCATPAEEAWLGARLVDRQQVPSPVADVGGVP